jgi:hypothetical protein
VLASTRPGGARPGGEGGVEQIGQGEQGLMKDEHEDRGGGFGAAMTRRGGG